MPDPIAQPTSPNRSPSYPQRVHIRERAQWNGILADWDAKIIALGTSPRPGNEAAAKLLAQMNGARDQIADAARRLPMEVGDLYEEDHERLENAVASLERLFDRWSQLR